MEQTFSSTKIYYLCWTKVVGCTFLTINWRKASFSIKISQNISNNIVCQLKVQSPHSVDNINSNNRLPVPIVSYNKANEAEKSKHISIVDINRILCSICAYSSVIIRIIAYLYFLIQLLTDGKISYLSSSLFINWKLTTNTWYRSQQKIN